MVWIDDWDLDGFRGKYIMSGEYEGVYVGIRNIFTCDIYGLYIWECMIVTCG